MKYIELSISATTFCDRGCTHCISMADTKNPVHFSLASMEKILSQVRDYKRVRVVFTGGGEPLFNPKIVELLDLCHVFLGKRLSQIYFITSGFSSEEEVLTKRFLEIVEKRYAPKIKLAVSFSLFEKHFPDRLKNTFIYLARYGKEIRQRKIRMCLGRENFGRTYRALAHVLNEVEVQTGTYIREFLVDTTSSFFEPEFFLRERWSEQWENSMTQEAMLNKHLVIMQNIREKYSRALFIKPFSVEKFGRAVGIRETSLFSEHPSCPFIFWEPATDREIITLSAGGLFVPEVRCTYSGKMGFGKVGEITLAEHFRRRESLRQGLLKHMLCDSRPYNLRQVCKICASYRQTKFEF